ncbi:MAG: radical SAM protein [Candidatus Omnitrophota bacterium]|nr:radical SAM protein [Candidatus Omnitrophota bacterium]
MNKDDKLKKVRIALDLLKDSLSKCAICPRRCKVNRFAGKLGYCRAPYNPVIYSYMAHHGEEPALSGSKGSGTIFFSRCNMKCAYCQNYIFSQLDGGDEISIEKLASIMLELQQAGCHNINLVNPTHYVPQILMALEIAVNNGLSIPIVYNTSGYDLTDTIRLLDGIIDIYLPDMRYSDNRMAKLYSDAPDYVERDRTAVKEMYRQAGNVILDDDDIAIKGLIIRLLVLPHNISGTTESLKFIKENISKDAYLSIMSQYYPTYKACDFKELSCGILEEEYKIKVDEAHKLGLNNGWIQEMPKDSDTKFLGTNIAPKSEGKR